MIQPGSDIAKLLKAAYLARRLFVNNITQSSAVNDILKTWAALLDPVCLAWHLKVLTGVSLNNFRKNSYERLQPY